jgi:hypothetical protein
MPVATSALNLDATVDALGAEIGRRALLTFVRLAPGLSSRTDEQLQAACDAMKAAVPGALDQLLADAKAAPALAQVAAATAVLTIAQAGVAALGPAVTEAA